MIKVGWLVGWLGDFYWRKVPYGHAAPNKVKVARKFCIGGVPPKAEQTYTKRKQ